MEPVDSHLLVKAAALQAAIVGAVFVLLVLAPLPEDFFRRYGAITGPTAWILCSLATVRLLGLDAKRGAAAALLGGLAGALAGFADHSLGLVAAVLVFGAVCAQGARKPLAR